MKKLVSKIAATLFVCLFAFLLFTTANAAESTVWVENSKGQILVRFPVDTSAAAADLQKALDYVRDNSSASNILSVVPAAGTYHIDNSLNLYSHTVLDLSAGVTLKRDNDASMIRFGRGNAQASGYDGFENITIQGAKDSYGTLDGNALKHTIVRFAHAKNVTFRYLNFTNVSRNHHLEFAGSKDVLVENCKFNNFYPKAKESTYNCEAIQMDILTEGHFPKYDFYDNTVNKNITIQNCLFEDVNRGVGVHSGQVGLYMENIKITNNIFKNATGYAVVATNYKNSEISNNTIIDCGSGIIFRHITPGYINYYEGNSKTIDTNMNCVIRDNTISVKKTAFKNARYGISVYGKLLTKPATDNGTTFPAADYRVSGLTITGNTITSKTYANGIWLQGTINSTVSQNSVTYNIPKKESNSCDGIKLEDTDGIILTENTVTESSSTRIARSGFYIRNAENTTIKNCTVKNMYQDGIYLNESDGCIIENNTIDGVRKHGIYVDENSGTKEAPTSVKKNTIKNVGSRGICVNSGAWVNAESNAITKTGGHGICVTNGAFAANILNNTVKNAGDAGIYINDKSSADLISGNKITSPKGQGIYINSGSTAVTIEKNTITSSKSYGIFVRSSTATKIASNKIKSASRGINISGSTVKTLQSNTVSGSKSEGIYIASKAKVATVKKNKVSSGGKHGIHISGATVENLESNTISSSKGHGIYVKSSATLTSATKNTIVDSKECGIRVISSKVGKLTGNTIKKDKNKVSASDGIYLSGKSSATAISSNKLSNLKGHGIYLTDTTSVGNVQKNTIKKPGSHGMYIKNTVSVATISGNTIDSPKSHGIYTKDKSAVKTISGNIIKNVPENGIYLKGTGVTCTVKSNTITKCGEIGIDVGSGAKVKISGNKISGCPKATIRLMGTPYKKVSAEDFKIKSVKKDGKTLVLSWEKIKHVDEYIVLRSTSKKGTYKQIGTTEGTSFTDKNVKRGKTYYYKVMPVVETKLSTVKFAPSPVKNLKFR